MPNRNFNTSSRQILNLLCFFLFITPLLIFAQEEDEGDEAKEPLKLYIDCNCEKNYLRQEINYVSHVRDQGQANIKLFIYDVTNGSGGRTYMLEFEGVDGYKDILGKLTYDSTASMTDDEVRKGLLKKVQSGLLQYVLESDLAENITYTVNKEGLGEIQEIDFRDPWNNWIFEVYGEAKIKRESSRKEFEYELGFQSDHVTEKLRIRSDLQINQANKEIINDDETFTSERFRYSADASIVASLSDHWSAGVFGGVQHNTFTNLDFRYYARPAIEYNIYPYKEVLRREIVFAYKIGYFHNDYIEQTVFLKETEGIFSHSLDVQVRYRQPWGNVYARLIGSTFLNDFTKNRIQLNGSFSVRLLKGLAARFSGRFELIRDQINLPGGDASLEDVLLQQKQIATDYETSLSVGLSYTFGSAFNNVINTRL
ncbi:hypothetical protein [Zobellia barbeyronii]|uniref:hypothetical protein n=1 Tax=Zobellia barbeyronii TaxID=2748009 RepID=UPI001BE0B48E|nr:hypothetical protein [Zobellia barbeyronii]